MVFIRWRIGEFLPRSRWDLLYVEDDGIYVVSPEDQKLILSGV
jgi:hypothetical protein